MRRGPQLSTHAKDDEPNMLMTEGPISTQLNNGNTDPNLNIVLYKRLEGDKDKSDCHNTVKQLDENFYTSWRKELVIPDQYSALCDKFSRMLQQLESMWDGHKE